MTLIKRSNNVFPSVPSFFDDFFTRDGEKFNWANSNRTVGLSSPAVNVKEDEDNFEVEVAAPGLSKADFKIELENDVLTISSEKETSENETDTHYNRREFTYASFKRTFSLPEDKVDGENVKANYTDGVLHILLPKKEEAKPKPAKFIKIG